MMGNWSTNGDMVAICLYDLDTKEETVLFPRTGSFDTGLYSEAVERVYDFDGHLYVPHTDGLGYWEGCGYATDDGGWHNVRLPGQALHVFDMAQTSEGLWACGSGITPAQDGGQRMLWFRPNGGDWIIRHEGGLEPDGGRYYSITVKDDVVWVAKDYATGEALGFTADTMQEAHMRLPGYGYTPVITPVGTFKAERGVLIKE